MVSEEVSFIQVEGSYLSLHECAQHGSSIRLYGDLGYPKPLHGLPCDIYHEYTVENLASCSTTINSSGYCQWINFFLKKQSLSFQVVLESLISISDTEVACLVRLHWALVFDLR